MNRVIVVFMLVFTLLACSTMVFAEGAESVVETNNKYNKDMARMIDKYGDETNGRVAYFLSVAQKYSIPICFVLLAIGALNFCIMGNKRLDKKQQGFSVIVVSIFGLAIFQILPLLFALLVL